MEERFHVIQGVIVTGIFRFLVGGCDSGFAGQATRWGVMRLFDNVVTQLSAVLKAIDRAGSAIISTGFEQCFRSEDSALDKQKLKKLFLSPA